MNEAELRTLLTPEALRLVDELGPITSTEAVTAGVTRLRKAGHPPELVAVAMTQARLRTRATAKFGDFADRMLYTEAGLQQATRLEVAARHAARFRDAGVASVADLGCGIGADALALAGLGIAVRAIERDPVTAAIAAYNLASFPDVEVVVGDAETAELEGVDGVWLDPARRAEAARGGARRPDRLSPADWSPSLDFAFGLGERHPAGVKLGPGMDRELLPADAEAQWVSVRGEVVEVVAWFGAVARAGIRRSALVIGAEGAELLDAPADSPDVEAGRLGGYLLEPDGAVIRARLIGDLARSLGPDARMLDPTIAWITTDAAPVTPFGQAFRVLAELPIDEKAIRRELAARGIGRLEIKTRGVDLDPAAYRKRLAPKGEESATLILTRIAGRRRAILAARL